MTTIEPAFIHRFVPGSPEEPVTLLLLHGTGGDETGLLPLGPTLLPGAALLSPRGKVLEGGQPRFFRRLAPGVFDEEDLLARTDELADFVRSAAAAYGRDAGQFVAVGYSNGANIGASLLLRRPDAFGDAILLRPMLPVTPEHLPDLRGRAVLIVASRADPLVPAVESERLAALLGSAGAEVALSWQSGGHGIGPRDVAAARDWLARRLRHAGSGG